MPATGILIRDAAPGDFEHVSSLLVELGRPAVSPANAAVLRAVYARYLQRADTAPLVAELDGRVVGFLSLEFLDRLSRDRPQAWIAELIVAQGQRRKGAGMALFRRALELVHQRNCWSLRLDSRDHQQAAHRLYRAAGMKEVGSYFLLEF
jgi:GNAT superfamily N-acetyltransferase